jgi:hypothetical protein
MISASRLEDCMQSAEFWGNHIGLYADWMQTLSDRYAISASLLSAVTGLTIWGSVSASAAWWAEAAAGLLAFAASACAVVPKVRGYGDCARQAAPLSAEYSHCLGDLQDALDALKDGRPKAQQVARKAVAAYEATKAKKDGLRPYPRKLQALIDAQRPQRAPVVPQPTASGGPANP